MPRKFLTVYLIIINLYFAPTVRAVTILSEKGFGYIEDASYQQEKCISTPIKLGGMHPGHPFALSLKQNCRAPETVEIDSNGHKPRPKRGALAVVALIASAVAIGITGWNYICDWSRASERTEELKKLEEYLNLEHSDSKLTFELLKGEKKERSQEFYDKIKDAAFTPGKLEFVMNFFELDKEKLINEMGYKNDIGTGVLRKMEHTLFCGINANNYVLEICAFNNPTRVYGNLTLIAPIGNFINNGELFSYYNTSRLAVYTKQNGTLSADKCETIGKQWSCTLAKEGCNVAAYNSCTPTIVHTPDHVFSMDIADMTYIATTVSHYSLYENGSSTAYKTLDVPASGHFLIRAPDTSFVQIGSRRFAGRHNTHEVVQLHANESMDHLSHAQLRQLKENWAKEGVALSELHEMRLHDSVGLGGGIYDTVYHYVMKYWYISAIVGILVLLFFIYLVIQCLKCTYRKVKCGKKKKNDINVTVKMA